MSKRGQSKSGEGEFTHLVDSDLEGRRQRRAKKLASKSEKGERGLWTQELGEAEVSRTVREQAKKEKRARIAALYSDMRIAYDTGKLSRSKIKDYLKDFPSGAEHQAFEEVSEAVRQGKIDREVQKLETKIKTATKSLRHEKVSRKEVMAQERMKMLMEAARDRIGRAGPPREPETRESFFSAEEWREALLREYAAGRLDEDDLKSFFEYYSADEKAAYEKLAEEEGIKLRGTEEEIGWDEIGDRILADFGFRKEFIKDIPTEEGKVIFDEMLDEQIDAFKQILHGTISREDLEKKIIENRAGEIKEKEKIGIGEARVKAEALVQARAEAARESTRADIELMRLEETGTKEEIQKAEEQEKLKVEDLYKADEELAEAKAKAEKELVAEAAKKFLAVRELFTHGLLGYNKEKGQMVLGRYSDLDGKCAIALFGKAGIDISKTEYLKPGEYKKGQVTVDSGEKDGLVFESAETVDPKTGERKTELTTVFDHHGPYSDRGTSATAAVYKVLAELGLLKFEDEKEKKDCEKVVGWVTQSDNFSFSGVEKYFDSSDRRMIGFLKFRNFDQLLKFAASGKEMTDLLSDKELAQFELIYRDQGTGKFIDRPKERRRIIEETKGKVRELASRGWLVSAKDGKKFLIDTTGEVGGEFQWAAASLGYDGIIRYNQETQGFFVAVNKGEFDPKIFEGLPQGKLMRKSMFSQLQGREKLTVALGDLVNRLSPGFEPGARTELKRFLERETWRIRTVVSRSPDGWWWTNTPSGKKVVVRGLPEGFKSGQEAYLLLEEPRNVRDDEKRKYGGNFYIGYWEPDEIVLPKKPEATKGPAKTVAALPKPEIRKPEAKKEPPAKVEIKRPVVPEVKAAAVVQPEVKTSVPKVEKPRTPEERKRAEEEIAQKKAEFKKKTFDHLMKTLGESPVWGKKDEEEREAVAQSGAEIAAKSFEATERKKYGI